MDVDHSSDAEAPAIGVEMGDSPKSAAAPTAAAAAAAHAAKRQEAAALLALWSALVLTEGTVRFVLAGPGGDLTPADRLPSVPPPLLSFLAALMECAFGLGGVIVGAAGAFFGLHNRKVTKAWIVTQVPMSWFVFIIYVFLRPAYRAHFLTEPIFPFASVGASRAFITMGILTSASFCLALQGGQFAFAMRLLAYQAPPGKASAAAAAKESARALFWNGNMAFAGASTFVASILLLANASGNGGASRLDGVFVAPPHVGVFPMVVLFCGLVMVTHGVIGMAAGLRSSLMKLLGVYTPVNYIYLYLNFTILQLGAIRPAGPPEAAAFHSGLVLLTVLIGPYFSYQAMKVREEKAVMDAAEQ